MGTLKNAIQSLLGWDKGLTYNSKFITANKVVFSSYGNDIHINDMVKTAIHRVAEAVSKCEIKSVIERKNPRLTEVADDDINAVLTSRVNPL